MKKQILTIAISLVLFAPGAAAAEESRTIAAAGDISCPELVEAQANAIEDSETRPWEKLRCRARDVAGLIRSNNPTLVLALGDLIQRTRESRDQKPTRSAFSNFDQQWDAVRGLVRPTVGNHEYGRTGKSWSARAYFEYWEELGLGPEVVGGVEQGWSSWRIGSWQMINLNSNCFAVDCSIDGSQMRWLVAQLKRYRSNPSSRCLAAYFHHPLFSAGVPGGRLGPNSLVTNIWSLLYMFGADLVINGHQHFYERHTAMDQRGGPDATGITQIISGTGGTSLFRSSLEDGSHLASSMASTSRYGATFIELGPSSWSSVFRDIRGGVFDQTTPIECHGKPRANPNRQELRQRYREKLAKLESLDRRRQELVKSVRRARSLRDSSGSRARIVAKLRRVEERLERQRSSPLR